MERVSSEEFDSMMETAAKVVKQVAYGFQIVQPDALFLLRKNSRQQRISRQMQWQTRRS